jgi:diaminopimelate epimerase
MTRISFTKMAGAGNDFILLDGSRLPGSLSKSELTRRLAPRRTSVGADGVLIVKRKGSSGKPELDYYNADGSRAFCGNGSRCAAWWMHQQGWAGKNFSLNSSSGPIEAVIVGHEKVRIRMPDVRKPCLDLKLKIAGKILKISILNTGVPHALLRVKNLENFPVLELGRALRCHSAFKPQGTNVNFVHVGKKTHVRTYERGVEEETLSCGTGAVAAALCVYLWTKQQPPIRVETRGGLLTVRFRVLANGGFENIWLEGPAKIIYRGELKL